MLHVDGLCKSYGGTKILEPVSFYLPAGFCLGITGANGAGKSTLLRLIAQQEKPDAGTIRLDGTPVLGDHSFIRSQVGYVPQHNDLMEDLTVRLKETQAEKDRLAKELQEYQAGRISGTAQKAMEQIGKLRGCEVHSSVILSAVDEKTFKRLGVNLTCQPRFKG